MLRLQVGCITAAVEIYTMAPSRIKSGRNTGPPTADTTMSRGLASPRVENQRGLRVCFPNTVTGKHFDPRIRVLSPKLRLSFSQAFRVAAHDDDCSAILRKRAGTGQTDPPARTGDQCAFTFQCFAIHSVILDDDKNPRLAGRYVCEHILPTLMSLSFSSIRSPEV